MIYWQINCCYQLLICTFVQLTCKTNKLIWSVDQINFARSIFGHSEVGLGDKWCIFVKLMQAIWEQGCMPEQMKWAIIVLLPKGNGEYCGISLLDPFCKSWKRLWRLNLRRSSSMILYTADLQRGGPGLSWSRPSSTRAWPGVINARSIRSTLIWRRHTMSL